MDQNSIIDDIFAAFRKYGQQTYGERVTMMAHMLQSAVFAERDRASETLIAAALLHDYGHLIHDLPEDIAEQGIDAIHEEVGANYLAAYFDPAVTEPGRLHVAAKRYLCAVDPAYFDGLSSASVQSLALQGGPFNEAEVHAFEQHPYFQDAIRLRRYDDLGKEPEMETPDLEYYRPILMRCLRS